MNEINKRYDIEIEILTPLSIGAGNEKDWIKGVDFIVDGSKLYKLNLRKIVGSGIDIKKISSFLVVQNEKGIINYITKNKLQEVSDKVFLYPNSVDPSNEIKTFVKNQFTGKPILPGSSLKGAIRSVLFKFLKDKLEKNEKDVFGDTKNGNEFMRFIKISDTEFDDTILVNTLIFNLHKLNNKWMGGWKHKGGRNSHTDDKYKPNEFNTLYESIKPGQKESSQIMMSPELFRMIKEHSKKEKKLSVLNNDLTYLFGIINNHTRTYLNKEKSFFEKYNQAERTDDIINSIETLLNKIPADNNYCILKMSAGSGFHSITGDWQYDDYIEPVEVENNGKCKYKSRKIVSYKDNLSLMGFVKLRILSEDECSEKKDVKNNISQKNETYRLKSLEAERLKKEKEEHENQVRELVKNANELYISERWDEALEIFSKLKETIPDNTSFDEKIEEINVKITELALQEIKEKELIDKKNKNNIELNEKISHISKLPTLFGNVKTWLKANDKNTLSENELLILKNKFFEIFHSMKPHDRKNINSQCKGLYDIVDKNIIEQWLKELYS